MTSRFGRRLFRLFALFALLPALALAAAGYYLAIESGDIPYLAASEGSSALAEYHNRYLMSRLESNLTDSSTGSVDFAGSFDSLEVTFTTSNLNDSAERLISLVEAIRQRESGFVTIGDSVYQFVSKRVSGDRVLFAGLIHGPEYQTVLSDFQAEQASRSSLRRLRVNYLLFLGTIFLVLSILVGSIAYFFSARMARSLAKPIQQLSEAAEKIADGDFNQTVEASGVDEIAILVTSFNRMSEQLEEMTARLTQTERVAAWRSVARRFAHELKNPLQPILVSLYQIDKKLKNSPEYAQISQPLKAVSEEITHLTELADRFSKLAKLPPPKLETVSLNQLLESVVRLYSSAETDYRLEVRLPDNDCDVVIDESYFREALHNLIQNAVDATAENGLITIAAQVEQDQVRVAVTDDGCGMPADVIAAARIPYFSTKEKGNGLGLAIVEKTVSELGGRLAIESRQNHGTTVTMTFPRQRR